jgi:hypothetical protein
MSKILDLNKRIAVRNECYEIEHFNIIKSRKGKRSLFERNANKFVTFR